MTLCTEYCDWLKSRIKNQSFLREFFNLSVSQKIELFIKETLTSKKLKS